MTTARQFTREAAEARYGYKVAARLHESSEAVPHEVAERLKAARFQALGRRKKAATAPALAPALQAQGVGSATLGMGGGDLPGWLQTLLYALPALVLAVGIWGLHQSTIDREQAVQLRQVADVDAEMLADELPPVAFLESGFSRYVKDAPQ
ncbi:MAG: DUF3619 family protein [Betaproteobacteria bacterium]|nr:DUF3619 family protein [Betaproteobacteria bacterium]